VPKFPFPICDLLGMPIARTDKEGVLDHLFISVGQGRGGWLVTANLDFLRRHARDPDARRLYGGADVCVADGMPLVWAARLQGDRLPERIAGSDLLPLLAERAEREGRRIYLLGGDPTTNTQAVDVLQNRWPKLVIAGHTSPSIGSPPTDAQLASLRDEMIRTRPDFLLVGMGSPKQEQVIEALRATLPGAWMIGVGVSFSFVAGSLRRAPAWMQRTGLEWFWRMVQEPRRLVRRYLVEDLPFLFELVASVLVQRARGRLRR
jgi:N-acetylglucosaminyldiphosphoundecaprenol N-acetyl-beta-D-mannosaminyltransferase